MNALAGRRVLLLSENAPVPSDRRVWNESRALTAAGCAVTIVCAEGADRCREPYEVIEGIEIHRYPLRPAEGGAAGYAREYAQALVRIRRIVRALARERRFDVVHACNPPDFLLLAAFAVRRTGARFVFDHHDLVPELYRARYGDRGRPLLGAALALEQIAYRLADVVVVTNESYREVALGRGRRRPSDVFVVRNGPDTRRFRPAEPDPGLRGDRRHLIAYLGVMGAQDGIDHALMALHALRRRRDDWRALLVGEGEMLEPMRRMAGELGLADIVEFTGWRYDDDIRRILSSADVCLAPDPPSPLNDVSTMVKIPEYLAMGRPVASYDLVESRRSAGDAALYASAGDPGDLARCVDELLDDPQLRARMGAEGLRRVEEELSWQHSAATLVQAYERALAAPRRALTGAPAAAVPAPTRP